MTIQPSEIAFWSGAGISAPPPAAIPLGDHFTMRVLEHGCGHAEAQTIVQRLEAARLYDRAGRRKTRPRLEGVLQPLIGVLGADTALAPFSVIDRAAPNAYHEVFADHLASGGLHLTVNFDRCIEDAAPGSGTSEPTHLHGSYDPRQLEDLGVEVTRLSRGLPGPAQQAIRTTLTQASLLVVCGYSGRDYFDVDPFFRRLVSEGFRCPALEVLWIDHDHSGPNVPVPVDPDDASAPSMLRSLARIARSASRVSAPTLDVVVDLLQRSPPTAPHRTAAPAPPPSAPQPAEDRRVLATGAVLQYMGLHGDLLALHGRFRLAIRRDARERLRASRPQRYGAYAGTGRYRRAALLATRLGDGGPVGRAHATQVLASTIRQRGNVISATVLHAASALRFTRFGRLRPQDEHLRGDAYMEWLNCRRELHELGSRTGPLGSLMARLVAALTPSALLPRRVWDALSGDAEYLAAHPHSIAQLDRIREVLPDLAGAHAPPELESRIDERPAIYFEADSVTGYTNAERDMLRREAHPDPARVADLLERSRVIDDLPGILKAALLVRSTGAEVRMPLRELALIGWCYPWKLLWVWRWVRRERWRRN